jgi:hypothetical protein
MRIAHAQPSDPKTTCLLSCENERNIASVALEKTRHSCSSVCGSYGRRIPKQLVCCRVRTQHTRSSGYVLGIGQIQLLQSLHPRCESSGLRISTRWNGPETAAPVPDVSSCSAGTRKISPLLADLRFSPICIRTAEGPHPTCTEGLITSAITLLWYVCTCTPGP